ncbi:MAG: type II toxin-antitoxin system VapC family toxin [Candidatus Bathyarchaeia archaeon]
MRYIDSNVFIYPVIADEKTERKAFLARNILLKIAKGLLEAATSSLTWDELVWSVRRLLNLKVAAEEGEKFLRFPNLKLLSVDEKVVKEAQRLVKEYKLKPRDAIHSACAIQNGIKEIVSDDTDLDALKEAKRIRLEEI